MNDLLHIGIGLLFGAPIGILFLKFRLIRAFRADPTGTVNQLCDEAYPEGLPPLEP